MFVACEAQRIGKLAGGIGGAIRRTLSSGGGFEQLPRAWTAGACSRRARRQEAGGSSRLPRGRGWAPTMAHDGSPRAADSGDEEMTSTGKNGWLERKAVRPSRWKASVVALGGQMQSGGTAGGEGELLVSVDALALQTGTKMQRSKKGDRNKRRFCGWLGAGWCGNTGSRILLSLAGRPHAAGDKLRKARLLAGHLRLSSSHHHSATSRGPGGMDWRKWLAFWWPVS